MEMTAATIPHRAPVMKPIFLPARLIHKDAGNMTNTVPRLAIESGTVINERLGVNSAPASPPMVIIRTDIDWKRA
ncbi:hypothetical protein ACPBZO_20750 [Escherichia coli]|nr:hypothetical protein [Escherichia coli]BDO05693.1 hypothetical protein KAM622c_52800 [Klebsiella quasipneumoniae subsp. quasipneumoniae]GKI68210.1 hypothetical protein NUKP6_36690 [Klebsiella variicola]SQM47903.1 Uncharacterised protein [Escherichia coli]BDO16047.1 hypothetical protein KAM644c_51130 [Klebsiella quasipneumoniae subsp. quasipneumoniae]BDO22024.1 hypothetical protein KAM645c_51140 [Klebsiella quasipneumoniae subsp. quasipneumoniae]